MKADPCDKIVLSYFGGGVERRSQRRTVESRDAERIVVG